MHRNKLKHCCFSSNDSFIHGNPWLLSSMSCKSRLYLAEKTKWKLVIPLHIKTRPSLLSWTHPIFCDSKAFFKISKPSSGVLSNYFFLEISLDFSLGGWSERSLQQFMPVSGDSLQFTLFNISWFWKGGGSEWVAFVWKTMLTINHNDRLMLRLMMIFWC